MSQYEDSDVDMQEFSEAGTAQGGGVSLSTTAATHAELPRSLVRAQESTNSNKDFSPTTR